MRRKEWHLQLFAQETTGNMPIFFIMLINDANTMNNKNLVLFLGNSLTAIVYNSITICLRLTKHIAFLLLLMGFFSACLLRLGVHVLVCCPVCLFLYGCFCHGALKLSCLHCVQHSFFIHLFNLYYIFFYFYIHLCDNYV